MDVILCGIDLYLMSFFGEVYYWVRKDNIFVSDGFVMRIEFFVV